MDSEAVHGDASAHNNNNNNSNIGTSPPRPPRAAAAEVPRADMMRQFIGGVMTSKTVRLWSEIRTFKTLYESLQRLARDIYFKYIDINSIYALEGLSDSTRDGIREKALRSASVLYYDTFDDLKTMLIVALEKELAKGKAVHSPRSGSAPEIVFPRAAEKKKPKKEKELFTFLSDGDEEELEFRTEEQKLSEVGSALTNWYGQDWEKQAKRKRKEKKEKDPATNSGAVNSAATSAALSSAAGTGASNSTQLPGSSTLISNISSGEAFPGIPLHVAPPSLKHSTTAAATTTTTASASSSAPPVADSVVAFPGVPMHDEQESFEKLLQRKSSTMHVVALQSSSSAPNNSALPGTPSNASLGSQPTSGAAATSSHVPANISSPIPSTNPATSGSSAAANSISAAAGSSSSAPVRDIVFPGIPLYSETERPWSPVARPGTTSPPAVSSPPSGKIATGSNIGKSSADQGSKIGPVRQKSKEDVTSSQTELRSHSPSLAVKSPDAGISPRQIREKVIPPEESPAFPGIPLRVIEPALTSASASTTTVVAPSAVSPASPSGATNPSTSAATPASSSNPNTSASTKEKEDRFMKRRESGGGVRGIAGAFSPFHHHASKKTLPSSTPSTDSGEPFPGIPVHDLDDRPKAGGGPGGAKGRLGLSMSEDSAFPGIPVHVVSHTGIPTNLSHGNTSSSTATNPINAPSSNATAAAAVSAPTSSVAPLVPVGASASAASATSATVVGSTISATKKD